MEALKIKLWVLIWYYKNFYGFINISVKVLYAQMMHETGNLKSEVFKQNNNLFGMREAKVRKRSVEGSNLGHAVYKNHSQSVVDYFLRQKNFRISNQDDTSYINDTVNSNYAEDKSYKEKWVNTIKTIKIPILKNIAIYGGLFFLDF
jgi:flagellum-specific peptidoglycan hydrolase FlgJ